MDGTGVVLTLKKGRSVTKVEGTRVAFSPHQCFPKGGNDASTCLAALADYLKSVSGLAVCGNGGRAQTPSATFFGENVAWEKSTIN